jgi:hypothetical protein
MRPRRGFPNIVTLTASHFGNYRVKFWRLGQDRKYEARRSLEEILCTFDEGLETADLKDAKQLLNDLP